MLISGISQINSQWISNYYGNSYGDTPLGNAHGTAVCVDNIGYCYVTGYVDENNGTGNNVLVIKYDPQTGDTIWTNSYNGNANGNDIGNDIKTDAYGNVYITGTETVDGRGLDLLLLKYSADGQLLFHVSKSGYEINAEDCGKKIAFDIYGNIYVTGYCTDSNQVTSIFTVKFDFNGFENWKKIENGASGLSAKGSDIAVNNYGTRIYIIGYVTSLTAGEDMVFIKYSMLGTKLYTKFFDGGLNSTDRAFGIAVDEQDYIYITGYSTTAATGTEDFVLLKYYGDGTRLWSSFINGEGNQTDRAFGIAVDEQDGCIFITGQSINSLGNNDYLTAAFDPNGILLWQKYYNGDANGDDEASAVGIITNTNETKSILVTGSSWGLNNNHDYATVRYNKADGELQTVSRYSMNTNTEDVAFDLAISDSSAYITGFSQLLGNAPVSMCAVSTLKFAQFEGSELKANDNIPSGFKLMQNYPNPFNPSTNIKFTIPKHANVKMTVYDVTGREVNVLINRFLEAGSYDITFVTQNLSSGIYFYELKAGSYRDVKKMTFIK